MLPSHSSSANGRSGSACVERGAEFAGPAHVASFAAWRSGAMRTTSHASPVFSSAQITQAEGSNDQRESPWRAEVGNA